LVLAVFSRTWPGFDEGRNRDQARENKQFEEVSHRAYQVERLELYFEGDEYETFRTVGLLIQLADYGPERQRLFLRCSYIRDLRIITHFGMWGNALIEIISIESNQWERCHYFVHDWEEDVFTFYREDFTFKVEAIEP
jgi:hypothetical protein